jgi:hypothetical protein
MTDLKSLAHPEWPYTGTAHEWRGFVKGDEVVSPAEYWDRKLKERFPDGVTPPETPFLRKFK